jgi:nucleotidyltransferase AbiEii toxin of type IV toxin-antitoxin system
VLKGGIGLLTRLPGARYSKDVDLLHLTADPAAAEEELRNIGRMRLGDHIRFEITSASAVSAEDALRLTTAVYIGTVKWETFSIDVSCERHFVGAIEPVQPEPIMVIDGVPGLPMFRLYPLVDQIADKVAAMYEMHGSHPSNRYRDLVDLALLVGSQIFDAAPLLRALESRVSSARSTVVLPKLMESPGDGWAKGYTATARRSSLPADLHRLDSALAYVGGCLNPILDGTVRAGRWSPNALHWA